MEPAYKDCRWKHLHIFSVFRPACIDDDDSSFNASSSCVVLTTTSLVIWGPFYLMLILHRTGSGERGESK